MLKLHLSAISKLLLESQKDLSISQPPGVAVQKSSKAVSKMYFISEHNWCLIDSINAVSRVRKVYIAISTVEGLYEPQIASITCASGGSIMFSSQELPPDPGEK